MSGGFLLDTNVISELRKGTRANANVRSWLAAVDSDSLFLSVLVIGEIRRGIEAVRRRDRSTAGALERWLGGVVRVYSRRILPVDVIIAERWGQVDAADRLATIDGLLAATALVHDLVLVTRNVKDVVRTGVDVYDPFVARA